ncbi:hypothetical protein [Silvibacterium acidisoli]|uniref:hypothetical protein n=1 Tax=Acidobacteriaceae bacterium ZG23-2 TaxID=2883246 RepID=UPI00406C3CC7
MQLFENTVKFRGFLVKDAEAPSSDHIQENSFAVLLLATVSGVWDLGNNEWNPRTDWHRIICPGPFFCGLVRRMRRGEYLEVEGELRNQGGPRTVVVSGESHRVSKTTDTVYATRIQRLDRPDALVDFGDSDT